MKHKNFFKAVFTLLMCGSITLASAADIYLSNTGSDTNNGFSTGTPVKTLSKAFTMSLAGDVIHVMNMININEEPVGTGARATIDITGASTTLVLVKDGVTYTTWNAVNGTLGIIPHTRSLTIIGDDKASCGFDGNNVSCIIRQDHSAGTAVIDYKNLTFKNGNAKGDNSGGGAVYIRLNAVTLAANFYNCDFIANVSKIDKPGGAISVLPGTASFKLCRFAENIASKGAAMYVERGTVAIDSCVFENHDLTVASATLTLTATSVGAAIHTNLASAGQTVNLDVKNTLFKNNKSGANGGAFSTAETNPLTVLSGSQNIKFTNCAFVNNTAGTGLGGAAYIHNINVGTTQDVSFINTTFTGNQAGANTSGAIGVNSFLVNSKFNMINCTVSGNKVSGTSGAGGAGVRLLKGSAAGVRKIQNCILENNTAVDANIASAADYADLGMEDIVNLDLTTTPSYVAGTTLIIEKSLIGGCKNTDFDTQFPLNKSNYAFELNGSIVNSYKAKLGVFNEEKNYFPLLATSEAIDYGNVLYLNSLTPAVTTDQIGRKRPATVCSAGAYEFATVSGLKNTVNNSIMVYWNANNQITVKNADATAGIITVCNMVGQVMYTTAMNTAITTINKSLTSGVYLVLVNINGKISSTKVIL
jgi:hypothetical protein